MAAPPSVQAPPPSNDAAAMIRVAFREAHKLVSEGRLAEAVKVVGALLEDHGSSGLAQFANAKITCLASQKSDYFLASNSYFNKSLEFADRALTLSPWNIQLAMWYSKDLLTFYNKSNRMKILIDMYIQLLATDPVDPATEDLEDEGDTGALETPELRMEFGFARIWHSITCDAAKIKEPPLYAHQVLDQMKETINWKKLVLPYLKSLSPAFISDEVLSVSTSDLRTYLSSLNFLTHEDKRVLSRALSIVGSTITFKPWICYSCEDATLELFVEPESHRDHISEMHVNSRPPTNLEKLLPKDVDCNWVIAIEFSEWMPLDVTEDRTTQTSTDKQRTKLLGEVKNMLKELLKNYHLSQKYLDGIVDRCKNLVGGYGPATSSFGFMTAIDLQNVLDELHCFSKHCKPPKYGWPDQFHQENPILERLVFYSGASQLLLDGRQFPIEPDSKNAGKSVSTGDGDILDAERNPSYLVSWLCDYASIHNHLCTWTYNKEAKLCSVNDLFRRLQEESDNLILQLQNKRTLLNQREAFNNILGIFEEEEKKCKHGDKYEVQCYEAALKQRQEQLSSSQSDLTPDCKAVELELISQLLDKEVAMKKSDFARSDDCILEETMKKLDDLSQQLMIIESMIMPIQRNVKMLKLEIEIASVFDFRNIILPLVKSFVKQKIGDLADKYAEEKLNAPKKFLLKELDDDARRTKRDGPPKQGKQKLMISSEDPIAYKDAEEKSNAGNKSFLKELDDDAQRTKGDGPPNLGKQKMINSEEPLAEATTGEFPIIEVVIKEERLSAQVAKKTEGGYTSDLEDPHNPDGTWTCLRCLSRLGSHDNAPQFTRTLGQVRQVR